MRDPLISFTEHIQQLRDGGLQVNAGRSTRRPVEHKTEDGRILREVIREDNGITNAVATEYTGDSTRRDVNVFLDAPFVGAAGSVPPVVPDIRQEP
jgi:hypothetical protein